MRIDKSWAYSRSRYGKVEPSARISCLSLVLKYLCFCKPRYLQCPNTVPGIPTFETHEEHRRHILVHTAATFRNFARSGFTEGMAGHISVRDPEFEHYIWMNPLGLHFGLMTAGDLLCLDVRNGNIVGGNRVGHARFIVYGKISGL